MASGMSSSARGSCGDQHVVDRRLQQLGEARRWSAPPRPRRRPAPGQQPASAASGSCGTGAARPARSDGSAAAGAVMADLVRLGIRVGGVDRPRASGALSAPRGGPPYLGAPDEAVSTSTTPAGAGAAPTSTTCGTTTPSCASASRTPTGSAPSWCAPTSPRRTS